MVTSLDLPVTLCISLALEGKPLADGMGGTSSVQVLDGYASNWLNWRNILLQSCPAGWPPRRNGDGSNSPSGPCRFCVLSYGRDSLLLFPSAGSKLLLTSHIGVRRGREVAQVSGKEKGSVPCWLFSAQWAFPRYWAIFPSPVPYSSSNLREIKENFFHPAFLKIFFSQYAILPMGSSKYSI